jgi:predicted HAD superfamily Cof-like phosphohydrolase
MSTEIRQKLNEDVNAMTDGVDVFQKDLMKLPCANINAPQRLPESRRNFRTAFLQEELNEFAVSKTIEDDIDALIDLIYVALGALLEMGVDPMKHFDVVQDANMSKVRGATKRGEYYDAVKPEGWQPPDHEAIIEELKLRYAVAQPLLEATKIVLKRGEDYNHGEEVKREDHFVFGLTSIFSLMWVKIKRLEADIRANRPIKRDHLLDLINYSRFGVDFIDGRKM